MKISVRKFCRRSTTFLKWIRRASSTAGVTEREDEEGTIRFEPDDEAPSNAEGVVHAEIAMLQDEALLLREEVTQVLNTYIKLLFTSLHLYMLLML